MTARAAWGIREQILATLPILAAHTMHAMSASARVAPVLNCVDMSMWGGPLTPDEVMALKARGIRLVIVGTGNPFPGGAGQYARQQASAWIDGGGDLLDGYVYLRFDGDPVAQVGQALATLRGLPVRGWWLDAEDIAPESRAMTPSARASFLRRCITALQIQSPETRIGIYSGAWWWRPYMGNTTEFKDYPLWDSYYPDGASADNVIIVPWAGREYGAFAAPEIDQYKGTTMLGGQSVDLSAADLEEDAVNEILQALVTERENDLLAAWGGDGEQDLPRAKRLEVATYRRDKAVSGIDDSVGPDGKPNKFLGLDALIGDHLSRTNGVGAVIIPGTRFSAVVA